MKLLWHYTVDRHLVDILQSGYVDIARLHLAPSEKPVAWFSANQFWERTVRKSIVKFSGEPSPAWGLEEMFSHGIHGVRIGVLPDAAPLNWTALRIQANIPAKMARQLLQVAEKWGANPWDWHGSLAPVPREQWQATEIWNGNEWTPFAYDNEREELYTKLRTDDPLAPIVERVCAGNAQKRENQ